ncbi:MAG: molybdopterin molybdotransferase MoeA [Rubrivivax sp.]|nr:molybdopterin molybdotransferase MoeA [Rubrivivax sp.]
MNAPASSALSAPRTPRATLSLDEALARLAEGSAPHALTATESVSTFEALGRVLAADVRSALDVPPADNTSMDGYAVRAADVVAAGTVLPVSQRIPAGVVGAPLVPGTAARIFTGAQVPPGADAVVMQEQCEPMGADAGTVTGDGAAAFGHVRFLVVPAAGQWVRRRGEDVRAGATVLARGARLTPQALGLAASVGAGTLQVLRRPRVAVFSTGDELVMPGEPLKPGAIYNSNRFTLRGLLQAAGCEVNDLGIVPDRLDATRDALRRAAAGNDLIVTSGGVSVGEEDHLRPAVLAEGRLENWQIAMKPGKPLAFGAVRRARADAAAAGGEALFVGLPGNPVSSFVTFVLCVSTVLRAMQGLAPNLPRPLLLRAAFDWPRPDKRREFLRVRLNAAGELELFDNQSSGVLTSAVWADGLVDNPPGQAIARGDAVRYLPLSELVAR